MTTPTAAVKNRVAGPRQTLPIAALALVIALVVQAVGQLDIDLGIGSVIVFPMVWGLILGLLVSVQKVRPSASVSRKWRPRSSAWP